MLKFCIDVKFLPDDIILEYMSDQPSKTKLCHRFDGVTYFFKNVPQQNALENIANVPSV